MKKWELVLLIALVLSLLAGLVFPSDTSAPEKVVYAWWGTVYPGFMIPENNDQGYVLKSKTAELWREMVLRLKTVA